MQPKQFLLFTYLLCVVLPIFPAEAVVLPVSWRSTEESIKHPKGWPSYTEQTFVFMKRIISTPPQWSVRSFPGFLMAEEWLGEDITFAHLLAAISALGIHIELFYGYFSSFGSKEKTEYTGPVVDFLNRNVSIPLRRHPRRPSAGIILSSPFENKDGIAKDVDPNPEEHPKPPKIEDGKESIMKDGKEKKSIGGVGKKKKMIGKQVVHKIDRCVRQVAELTAMSTRRKQVTEKVDRCVPQVAELSTRSVNEPIRAEPSLSYIFQSIFESIDDDVVDIRQV